jgi:hypothetical protein
VAGSNGNGAWRALVTIVELLTLAHIFLAPRMSEADLPLIYVSTVY